MARRRQEEAEASNGRSLAAAVEAKRVVVAVQKELEDALARAENMTSRYQAMEAVCAKVDATAKCFVEATAAHLEQLQEVCTKHEGRLRRLCSVV